MNTHTLYQVLDTPDRSKTQLAYAANYLPYKELSEAAERLVAWQHNKMLYKGQILASLNEEMTELRYAPNNKEAQQWAIHWKYNAIPTQLEWERKTTSYIISCEFRVLLGGTKIVLLSF